MLANFYAHGDAFSLLRATVTGAALLTLRVVFRCTGAQWDRVGVPLYFSLFFCCDFTIMDSPRIAICFASSGRLSCMDNEPLSTSQ